jgi:transposase
VYRQHRSEGPPLRRRWKRGEQEQAIGRSRGGRTTKIHAVVDAEGRIIAFDLTAGNRHDIRPAAALMAPLPPAKSLLGDAAYDSDALRQFLSDRGTTPVIKPKPLASSGFRLTRRPTRDATSSNGRSHISRTGVASPQDTTSSAEITAQPSSWHRSCAGGHNRVRTLVDSSGS